MTEYYFTAENLAVGYGGRVLLKDIQICLKKGEILTLIGPNGAGKSTILKSITRQLKLLGGRVTIAEKELSAYSHHGLSQKMAVVLTDRVRPELMTCYDIVATGRYPYTGRLGILSREDEEKVDRAMALVQAESLGNRMFTSLSDGQKQRVLLARAICQEPEILVLDEPTSFLDIKYKLELLDLLRRMAKEQNITIILSLHEIDLAGKVSDKVMPVREGCVYGCGAPEEIFQEEFIWQLYGLERGSFDPVFGSIELPRPEGEPETLVLSAGGMGIPVYRHLQKEGIPFIAGILYQNDVDYQLARHLASRVILAEPFQEISVWDCEEAREAALRCGKCIYTDISWGSCNTRLRALLEELKGRRDITCTYAGETAGMQGKNASHFGSCDKPGRVVSQENEHDWYVWKNQKKLRMGYTTGSCAAGAAKAAVQMLLGGETVSQVQLDTPKGITLYLEVEKIERGGNEAVCAIQKDSGDDPDVTNGIYVYVKAEKTDGEGIELRGGEGVGIVTRKGLGQEPGEPAINPVPRRMILGEAKSVCDAYGYEGGLALTVFIPEGAELAARTFNPRLGIEGGLSVLGTTGMVEPMSEKALVDTIFAEMNILKNQGRDVCYVVPGNYGSDFLRETLGYDGNAAVKCSNYIGETIDIAVRLKLRGILFIGHIGKLVKLAAGIMNTHSHQADCRLEVLASHAAMAGAGRETVCRLMKSITTSEALELLEQEQLMEPVMGTVMEKIEEHLEHRAGKELRVGAILFSPEHGILGRTGKADGLREEIDRKMNCWKG